MTENRKFACLAFVAASLVLGLPATGQEQTLEIAIYGSSIDGATDSAAAAVAACYVGYAFNVEVSGGKTKRISFHDNRGFSGLVSALQPPNLLRRNSSPGYCHALAEFKLDQGILGKDAQPSHTYASFTYVHTERLDWISDDEIDLVFDPTLWPEWWDVAVAALIEEINRIAGIGDFTLEGRICRTALTITTDVCISVLAEYRMDITAAAIDHLVGKDNTDRMSRALRNERHGSQEFTRVGPTMRGGGVDYALLLVSSRPIVCTLASIDMDELSRAIKLNASELLGRLNQGTTWHSADLEILKHGVARQLELHGVRSCGIYIARVR